MSKRTAAPWIGIPVNHGRVGQNFSAGIESEFVASSFVKMIDLRGALPVLLSPLTSKTKASKLAEQLDGLLLTSGQDIHPSVYGAKCLVNYEAGIPGVGKPFHRPQSFAPNLVRDEFELALYQAMRKKRKPVFGICRGFQLINVAEGGTLYQELPETSLSHCIEADGWIPYHDLKVQPDSQFHFLLKRQTLSVPSIHHQGIHLLAKSLRAVGLSEDRLVEAIELKDPSDGFVMGVQGHIEKVLGNYPAYGRLLDGFINAAKGSR